MISDTIAYSAPGRASIIGNPTDIYGGSVVSCALEQRAYAAIEPSDVTILEVCGVETTVSDWESTLAFQHDELDVARAVLGFLFHTVHPQPLGIGNLWRKIDHERLLPRLVQEHFKLTAQTDIPRQAGLGGSTAILAVIFACFLERLNVSLNAYEMAEAIRWIEANVLGVSCGYQDHYMIVFGGLNYLDMRGKEMQRQDEDEPFATVEPLHGVVRKLPCVVAHTGVARDSGSVHGSIRPRWLAGEEKVRKGYERISEIGRLGKKALVEEDWRRLGRLMNENHAIQRELGGSGPSNEALIKLALDAGALGAKLAGAGRGGTIIALHPDPAQLSTVLLAAGAETRLTLSPAQGLRSERVEPRKDLTLEEMSR